MWTIFKDFIEFVTPLLLFYILIFLALRHVGFQLSDQGLNLHPMHWKQSLNHWTIKGSP